jgi:hypothetical protein
MKYRVYEYHGSSKSTHEQLKRICDVNLDTGDWEFSGSLDDFAEFYDGMFYVSADRTTIFITQHGSWGMR